METCCSLSTAPGTASRGGPTHTATHVAFAPAPRWRSRRPGRPPPVASLRTAGPSDAPPDYAAIDSQPLNQLVYGLFRRRMAAAVGADSKEEGYGAIIDMTRRLNALEPRATRAATQAILRSLFPPWLPPAFKVMFSRPLPGLSCRLNAWATWLTCQWLMGPCEVNDATLDSGESGAGHGVLVKRCRYLEEAGCASVCINSCKIPTQSFFIEDMGLPLTMEPNYDDFSCQFSFGRTPPPEAQDEAFRTPCFAQCTSARRGNAAGREEEACPRIPGPAE